MRRDRDGWDGSGGWLSRVNHPAEVNSPSDSEISPFLYSAEKPIIIWPGNGQL